MSKSLTTAELAKMTEGDLLREIAEQRRTVTKIRLAIQLGKEKGSHHLRIARKSLSRMLTVLVSLRQHQNIPTIHVS